MAGGFAQQAERFELMLAESAAPGDLERWLADPSAPAETVYARGLALPRETDGVRLVSRWVAEGKVTTHNVRDPEDERRWEFLARKAVRPEGRAPVADLATRGQLRSLLSSLRSHAERERPCPSLRGLARELGLGPGERGRRRAQTLIEQLVERGDIASECHGRNGARVVTILAKGRACGKSTREAGI